MSSDELAHGSWAVRDLPVLTAAAGRLEGGRTITSASIADETGLPEWVVVKSGAALQRLGYLDLVLDADDVGPRSFLVVGLTARGRQAVQPRTTQVEPSD